MATPHTDDKEENEMLEANIRAFLAATRAYLLDLLPVVQPRLATIPIRRQE